MTFGGKTGVTIDTSGTPTHVAPKSGDSTLRYVTTATGSALTSGGGNTCSIGSFKSDRRSVLTHRGEQRTTETSTAGGV